MTKYKESIILLYSNDCSCSWTEEGGGRNHQRRWERGAGRPTTWGVPALRSAHGSFTRLLRFLPNQPRQSIHPSRFRHHCQHSIPDFTGPWSMLAPMPSGLEPLPFRDQVPLIWCPTRGALRWSVELTPERLIMKTRSPQAGPKKKRTKTSKQIYLSL